jgi:hypothetical protein
MGSIILHAQRWYTHHWVSRVNNIVFAYPIDGNDNDDIDDNAPIRCTITDSWSAHF